MEQKRLANPQNNLAKTCRCFIKSKMFFGICCIGTVVAFYQLMFPKQLNQEPTDEFLHAKEMTQEPEQSLPVITPNGENVFDYSKLASSIIESLEKETPTHAESRKISTISTTNINTAPTDFTQTKANPNVDLLTNKEQKYTILFWTPLYSNENHWNWWFSAKSCGNIPCEFVTNRSTLSKSAAVVFHVYENDFNISDLPTFRDTNQRWVFFTIEPPEPKRQQMYMQVNGLMNWTMLYRLDADIPIPYKDGLQITPSEGYSNTNFAENKTAIAVWIVSHCQTIGHREQYVEELRKDINVDIIGHCGNTFCKPFRSDQCYKRIAQNYKFYLSFENILCIDYVTEKLFNVLAYPIVPIVFGGANYTTLVPTGSYIDALQFESPKALAKYIKELDKDDAKYNKYFDWKRDKDLTIIDYQIQFGCKLCQQLQTHSESKTYTDFYDWWYAKSKCTSWTNTTIEN